MLSSLRPSRDEHGDGELVGKILDKTGMKGTGKWTVQQAAELSIAAPTIAASLDSRYLSGLKEEREAAAKTLEQAGISSAYFATFRSVDKKHLIDVVRQALYASKICSYVQGMNLLKSKSAEKGWNLNLGELARIWKGGCIIRARFLDRIKKAYDRNRGLANLILDPEFAREMVQRQAAWRRVVGLAIEAGISTPGMFAPCLLRHLSSGEAACKLCRRKGTTLERTLTSGSTAQDPSTPSGLRSRGRVEPALESIRN